MLTGPGKKPQPMELKDNSAGVGEAIHKQRTGVKKVFAQLFNYFSNLH